MLKRKIERGRERLQAYIHMHTHVYTHIFSNLNSLQTEIAESENESALKKIHAK